jgi:hypothetical protein
LASSLSDLLGTLRFDRLRDAIENLDFRQGLQLLFEARSKDTPVPAPIPSESHP